MNLAQKYFVDNERKLLGPLVRKYGKIDEDTKQILLLDLGKKADDYWLNVDNLPGAIYDRAEKRCIDALRKITTRKEVAIDSLLDRPPGRLGHNPEPAFYAATLIAELIKASPKDDQDLIEYLRQGYEGPELADQFKISHDAARKRVSRLFKKLRKILNGSDKDPP
jgi:DNA-directed RNA polymerase specialized sigma24 family protein